MGADPLAHVCLHVALYGGRAGRWAMTERGAARLSRNASHLTIGPSALHWDGSVLTATIDERCAPVPRALRGSLRIRPRALTNRTEWLDPAGRHRWSPIAPRTEVELAFDEPSLRWRGQGYLDSNHGAEPLERGFTRWDWAAAPAGDGSTILYDTHATDGSARCLALRIASDGTVAPFEPPAPRAIGRTVWRLPRTLRTDDGQTVTRRMLVDAPFYARSEIEASIGGERRIAMHETVDLVRFARPTTQAMLAFRNPRW